MENNLEHLVGDENHHVEIDEAIDDMQNWKHPETWDQLQVGMQVEVLPINESKGWQKGTLRYNPGYKCSDPKSLYNLDPFWFVWVKYPDYFYPIITTIKDLSHVKIPA